MTSIEHRTERANRVICPLGTRLPAVTGLLVGVIPAVCVSAPRLLNERMIAMYMRSRFVGRIVACLILIAVTRPAVGQVSWRCITGANTEIQSSLTCAAAIQRCVDECCSIENCEFTFSCLDTLPLARDTFSLARQLEVPDPFSCSFSCPAH